MKKIKMYDAFEASSIALGCMRIADKSVEQVEALVKSALDAGINFFDHADIYGGGKSEELFGEVLKLHPDWREKMVIQTKCGIRQGYYDFSKEHILSSVETSLRHLQTDFIEVLLLHRPDTLMDPKEVAEAFDILYESGKVKYFGVSNMNVMQMELLQKYCKYPLKVNQLQFNPVNATLIDAGINVNMDNVHAIDRDGGMLEYARLHDITIQPWSILQASWEKGTFLNHPDYEKLNETLERIGNTYGISKTAVNLAWILRHPAKMQAIAGTTNPEHLLELCRGADVELTRQEWYEIYLSAGKMLP